MLRPCWLQAVVVERCAQSLKEFAIRGRRQSCLTLNACGWEHCAWVPATCLPNSLVFHANPSPACAVCFQTCKREEPRRVVYYVVRLLLIREISRCITRSRWEAWVSSVAFHQISRAGTRSCPCFTKLPRACLESKDSRTLSTQSRF